LDARAQRCDATLPTLVLQGGRVSLVLLLLWVADAWPEARDTRVSPQRLAPLRWAMWRTWRRYFECVSFVLFRRCCCFPRALRF
jgi:hypothetical protein